MKQIWWYSSLYFVCAFILPSKTYTICRSTIINQFTSGKSLALMDSLRSLNSKAKNGLALSTLTDMQVWLKVNWITTSSQRQISWLFVFLVTQMSCHHYQPGQLGVHCGGLEPLPGTGQVPIAYSLGKNMSRERLVLMNLQDEVAVQAWTRGSLEPQAAIQETQECLDLWSPKNWTLEPEGRREATAWEREASYVAWFGDMIFFFLSQGAIKTWTPMRLF